MELPGEHGHALGQKGDTVWMDKGQHQPQVTSLLSEQLVNEALAPGEDSWLDPPGDWFSGLTVCVLLTESLHCSRAPPMNAE